MGIPIRCMGTFVQNIILLTLEVGMTRIPSLQDSETGGEGLKQLVQPSTGVVRDALLCCCDQFWTAVLAGSLAALRVARL